MGIAGNLVERAHLAEALGFDPRYATTSAFAKEQLSPEQLAEAQAKAEAARAEEQRNRGAYSILACAETLLETGSFTAQAALETAEDFYRRGKAFVESFKL